MADLNFVEDKASQESKVPFSENIRSKEDAKKNIHVSDFVKSEHRNDAEGFIVLFRIPAMLSYSMDIAFYLVANKCDTREYSIVHPMQNEIGSEKMVILCFFKEREARLV